jgi:hypothetical protein
MRERGHVFYYPWYDNPQHNKDEVPPSPFSSGRECASDINQGSKRHVCSMCVVRRACVVCRVGAQEYLHWNHEVLANPFRQGSRNGAAYVPPEQVSSRPPRSVSESVLACVGSHSRPPPSCRSAPTSIRNWAAIPRPTRA